MLHMYFILHMYVCDQECHAVKCAHIYPTVHWHRSICVWMAFLLAALKESLCFLRTLLPTMDVPSCTDTLVLVSFALAPTPGSCHGTPPQLTTLSPWRLKEPRGGPWMWQGEWVKKKGFRWSFLLHQWQQSTLQLSLRSWQMAPASLIVLFSTQNHVVRAMAHNSVQICC